MLIEPRPRRSALYLPASNERALAKARTLAADIVILDLEDAVAPEQKPEAREKAVAAARAGGFGTRELLVRANDIASEWGRDDLSAIAQTNADGLLVPKVSGPADVAAYDTALADAPAGMALWAMIETCAAVIDLPAIAACAARTRLAGFVIGTNDLAKEMRARLTPDRAAFLPFLSTAVAAARAHGLVVLDGVCNEFGDLERFERECAQGLMLGFDGKSLIHPDQIAPCNRVFSPAPDEIAWAQAVIAAFALPENAGRGVLRVEGKMVELLHLDEARRIMALADRIAAAG
jgi:citrate lyase subunit beta/citryl-CoA lyase